MVIKIYDGEHLSLQGVVIYSRKIPMYSQPEIHREVPSQLGLQPKTLSQTNKKQIKEAGHGGACL